MSMVHSPRQKGTSTGPSKSSRTVRPRGAPVIRRPPWLVTATAASCLLAGGTWATVAKATGHHRSPGPAPVANGSDRFLQLTGDPSTTEAEHGVAARRDAS